MKPSSPDLHQKDPELAFIRDVHPAKPSVPSSGQTIRRITIAVCIPIAAIVGVECFKLGVHVGMQLEIERQKEKPYRLSGFPPDKPFPW